MPSEAQSGESPGVLHDLDMPGGMPHVVVGPTFFDLPIEAKQNFAETVSCFLTAGDTHLLMNFDLLDYRTGKKIARFSYGK